MIDALPLFLGLVGGRWIWTENKALEYKRKFPNGRWVKVRGELASVVRGLLVGFNAGFEDGVVGVEDTPLEAVVDLGDKGLAECGGAEGMVLEEE